MKKILLALFALSLLTSCGGPSKKVMARFVPERADDFVFENNLIAGRFYGKALEGNPTSPGLDIWVKLPGALVADSWYEGARTDPAYYHKDHGGKDCYKVAVSLGGGASVPFIGGRMCYPATNYRSWEILSSGRDSVRFTLEYPEWEAAEGIRVSLRKEVTVSADSYFAEVTDFYTFTGCDSLTVAAGIKLHSEQKTIEDERTGGDRYAIWEHASDQGTEPEDGMIGVAVIAPAAENILVDESLDHALLLVTIASGEPVNYLFGSCWSKGNIKTAEDWFALVEEQ